MVGTDPVSYLKLITGLPVGQIETSGDTATAAEFQRLRLTG